MNSRKHQHNVYRDGRVHVCSRQCDTCVFRSGNLMHLKPGRLRGMIQSSIRNDSAIVCHGTLGTSGNAVCRGFYDLHKTTPLQIAERLGMIEEVDPS